jgi:hypothetical protein
MKTIGIIIPTRKRFDTEVRLFGNKEERYVFINSREICFGFEFDDLIVSEDYLDIPNALELVEAANLRVKR